MSRFRLDSLPRSGYYLESIARWFPSLGEPTSVRVDRRIRHTRPLTSKFCVYVVGVRRAFRVSTALGQRLRCASVGLAVLRHILQKSLCELMVCSCCGIFRLSKFAYSFHYIYIIFIAPLPQSASSKVFLKST